VVWLKSQDDVVFGYSGSDEFFGDAVFDPIIMNPNFVVADFGMNDGTVDSMGLFP
jgi:hypothetical protein